MDAWRRAAGPALAAVLIAVGVLALDWANVAQVGDLSLRLTPRVTALCHGAACADLPDGHRAWSMMANTVLVVGVLAALALLLLAILRALAVDPAPLERARRWLCVALIANAGMAMIASGASPGELGGGGPVTLAGAILGLVAGTVGGGGLFGGGRARRPIRSTAASSPTAADPYREPAQPPAPAATPRRQPAPIVEVEPERRLPASVPRAKGAVRLAPAAPVAADATRGALRFVAAAGTLTETGLLVRPDRGEPRVLRFSDVALVVARRMPPDPPFDKTAFVDLVCADGPPVRLLPTTRLELALLPAGVAPNTKENWRRLVAHLCVRNPLCAIEDESRDFFAGDRDPPMFTALKKFVEWDRRYDSARTAR